MRRRGKEGGGEERKEGGMLILCGRSSLKNKPTIKVLNSLRNLPHKFPNSGDISFFGQYPDNRVETEYI